MAYFWVYRTQPELNTKNVKSPGGHSYWVVSVDPMRSLDSDSLEQNTTKNPSMYLTKKNQLLSIMLGRLIGINH